MEKEEYELTEIWQHDTYYIYEMYNSIGVMINELTNDIEKQRIITIVKNKESYIVDNISIVKSMLDTNILIKITTINNKKFELKICTVESKNGIRLSKYEIANNEVIKKDYEYFYGNTTVYDILVHDNINDEFLEQLVLCSSPKTLINHEKYIKSEEWDIKRKDKLKEANYKCQLCSNKDTELHVHHNNYDNLGDENMDDLIVLCKECHSKFHDK